MSNRWDNITKTIKASEPFLHLIVLNSARPRIALLSSRKSRTQQFLDEICLNNLQGNVPLDDKTYNRFNRHRQKLGRHKVRKYILVPTDSKPKPVELKHSMRHVLKGRRDHRAKTSHLSVTTYITAKCQPNL